MIVFTECRLIHFLEEICMDLLNPMKCSIVICVKLSALDEPNSFSSENDSLLI